MKREQINKVWDWVDKRFGGCNGDDVVESIMRKCYKMGKDKNE